MERLRRSSQDGGMRCLTSKLLALVLCLASSWGAVSAPQPAQVQLAGDWSVDVRVRRGFRVVQARVEIPPVAVQAVTDDHPDAGGMAIFADALMELFPKR